MVLLLKNWYFMGYQVHVCQLIVSSDSYRLPLPTPTLDQSTLESLLATVFSCSCAPDCPLSWNLWTLLRTIFLVMCSTSDILFHWTGAQWLKGAAQVDLESLTVVLKRSRWKKNRISRLTSKLIRCGCFKFVSHKRDIVLCACRWKSKAALLIPSASHGLIGTPSHNPGGVSLPSTGTPLPLRGLRHPLGCGQFWYRGRTTTQCSCSHIFAQDQNHCRLSQTHWAVHTTWQHLFLQRLLPANPRSSEHTTGCSVTGCEFI